MSIKIEINAENGADARKELIDLLGLGDAVELTTVRGKDLQFVLNRQTTIDETKQVLENAEAKGLTATDGGTSAIEVVTEPEKKKRRTKAEIEAEATKANTGSEEPPATEVEQPKEEVKADEFPTLRDVQILSGTLVRAGYKDKAIELVKTVGKAESTPAVAEENRQALIEAFKQLAADNKIALPE